LRRLSAVRAYDEIRGVERVISRIIRDGFQAFQVACILAICALGAVFAEAFVIMASFIAYRLAVRRSVHLRPLYCTLLSAAIFFIAASIVPSFKYSWFIPVIMAFAVIYGLYRAGVHVDKFKDMERRIDEINARPLFRCAEATAEEIRARCLEKGKSDRYADFMIAVHRSGRLHKDIAVEFEIAQSTVGQYKRERTREIDD
jgi:predicted nucleic acid-binding protein